MRPGHASNVAMHYDTLAQNRIRSVAPISRGAENVLSAKPIPTLELPEIR